MKDRIVSAQFNCRQGKWERPSSKNRLPAVERGKSSGLLAF